MKGSHCAMISRSFHSSDLVAADPRLKTSPSLTFVLATLAPTDERIQASRPTCFQQRVWPLRPAFSPTRAATAASHPFSLSHFFLDSHPLQHSSTSTSTALPAPPSCPLRAHPQPRQPRRQRGTWSPRRCRHSSATRFAHNPAQARRLASTSSASRLFWAPNNFPALLPNGKASAPSAVSERSVGLSVALTQLLPTC